MKQNWKYKIIATVFTAVVLFPFFAQNIHLLEGHEHTACNSNYEKYFHSDELECSICDYQINYQVFDFSIDYSIENFENKFLKYSEVFQTEYTSYSNFKPSRAPPHLV